MPWVHLHVTNQGKCQACCVANIPYGNINESTIQEIWNGDQIISFRNKQLAGEADNRCNICYSREAAGKSSMRIETNAKFKFDKSSLTSKSSAPKYYDIRFSNVCNLKCRTCWHGASSYWFKDAKSLKRSIGDNAILYNLSQADGFFHDLAHNINEVEEFYFAGGEPLITEEHYRVLNLLITHKCLDLRLRYNTNLTNLNFKSQEIYQYWNQFNNVELLISVDSIQDKNDLIRNGESYSKIIFNIKEIQSKAPHVKLVLAPTVSLLNILDLGQLHTEWIEQKLIQKNDIYLNLLERPLFYNVKALPLHLKDLAQQRIEKHCTSLKQHNVSPFVIEEFQNIINYMHSENLFDKQFPKLLKETALLDNLRSENTTKILKELFS